MSDHIRQLLRFISRELKLVRIENRGVVKRPLDRRGSVDERGLLRRLAGREAQIFAALHRDVTTCGLESNRPVNQRKMHAAVRRRDFQQKFRAANRPGGKRCVEFHIGGLFAIEKEQRAARQAEAFFFAVPRRKNFQRGPFPSRMTLRSESCTAARLCS